MNYRLRQSVELVAKEGEHFLVSKNPLSLLRLNRSLAELVSRGRDSQVIVPAEAEVAVLEQLLTRGFVEQVWNPLPPNADLPAVSIVIPVMNRADELRRCLDSLSRLSYPREKLQIIVVDDGSSDASPEVARQCGALLIPSGGIGRGPAAARNVGARSASGEILAFIDSDCSASVAWLDELIPAFADHAMAAVGGQVDGLCTQSAVDRYEAVMSSLSLGGRARTGNSGHDTFYLPSCNLLVRRSAFNHAGGFEESMHVGEDVDLTWRLRDRGGSISYLPAGNVLHEHRSTIRSFMSRRFDYGTSEGMLQLRHPARRKQMVIPPLLATVLALCLLAPLSTYWLLLVVVVILAADTLAVHSRLARTLPLTVADVLAGRLRAIGSLVYYLSYHLVRYYITPLIILSVALPISWFWLVPAAVFLTAAGVDLRIRQPLLSFPVYAGIYLLEQLAYSSGAFWGCVRRRCFRSYRIMILKHSEAT
jgi:mycofactocin system glycosyltransferase